MALDSTSAITQGWDVRQNTHTHTHTPFCMPILSVHLFTSNMKLPVCGCACLRMSVHTLCAHDTPL